MSVIVKGMKMPKSCGMCRFDDYGYCTMAKQYSGGSVSHGKASFCPMVELPEKHGDLIDKQSLLKELVYIGDRPVSTGLRFIREASTVIEAEDE